MCDTNSDLSVSGEVLVRGQHFVEAWSLLEEIQRLLKNKEIFEKQRLCRSAVQDKFLISVNCR